MVWCRPGGKMVHEKRMVCMGIILLLIIFALHVPLVNYTTRLAYIYWHNIPNYRLLTYLVVPIIVIFICIGTGALLRTLFPKAYRLATGGRGF